MSEAFFAASLVVAFIAGIVALAMPCCFSVLLPAYIAKSFDRTRGRLRMTGIFAIGIAAVLLPIAMGATALTSFLGIKHEILFVIGGVFMVILGLLTLWGMELIPQFQFDVDLQRKDASSVFALGLFSGVASSCCAPVLVGVIVLTSVSGGLLQAGIIGIAYVLGMVFPLLVAATLWDKKGDRWGNILRGRVLTFHWHGKEWTIHSSKFVAGALFIGMGLVTIALGATDRMITVPGSDLLGIYQTDLERALEGAFATFWVPLLILVAGAVLFLFLVRRRLGFLIRASAAPSDSGDPPTTEEDEPDANPGPLDAAASGESVQSGST